MNKHLTHTLLNHKRAWLTSVSFDKVLGGSIDRQRAIVKRAVQEGWLQKLRNELYIPGEKLGKAQGVVHPFLYAAPIYNPSYISLESALSYHGLIPEAVYTTTSVTTKPAKTFSTPLGLYSYEKMPAPLFYTGVMIDKIGPWNFFIATPIKALCDIMYTQGKKWPSLEAASEDLRLDVDEMPALTKKVLSELKDYYHHKDINHFLDNCLPWQV